MKFLFLVHAKNHIFDMAGASIDVKKAISKMNAAKNWALREAHKRIALLEAARGAEI